MANTRRAQTKTVCKACKPGDEHWPVHLEAAQRRAFLQALEAQIATYNQQCPPR